MRATIKPKRTPLKSIKKLDRQARAIEAEMATLAPDPSPYSYYDQKRRELNSVQNLRRALLHVYPGGTRAT